MAEYGNTMDTSSYLIKQQMFECVQTQGFCFFRSRLPNFRGEHHVLKLLDHPWLAFLGVADVNADKFAHMEPHGAVNVLISASITWQIELSQKTKVLQGDQGLRQRV